MDVFDGLEMHGANRRVAKKYVTIRSKIRVVRDFHTAPQRIPLSFPVSDTRRELQNSVGCLRSNF